MVMAKDKPEEGTNKAEPLKNRVSNFVFVGGRLVSFVLEGKSDPTQWLGYGDVVNGIKAGQKYEAIINGEAVDLAVNKIDSNEDYICTVKDKTSVDQLIPRVITKDVEQAGINPDGTPKPKLTMAEPNKQIINA